MRFCRLSRRREGVLGICRLVVSPFRRCITFAKSSSYTVDDIGWGTDKMISDLNGLFWSRQFLNVANKRTCFASRLPNNPGRPIVSTCSCPTELISSFLDKIMASIIRSLPSYVKDSQHALQIFRDFNFLGEGKLIFTMDITSLYTVIPNGEGLLALKHFF